MFGLIRNIDYLIVAILISVVLLVTSTIKYKNVSKANKSFTTSLVLLLISCLIEIFVTITRTYSHIFPPYIMHLMRCSYSIANGFLAIFIYRYARSYSGSFDIKKNWADYTALTIGGLYALISIIDIPTGIVTWFQEDGTFIHGPLYFLTFAGVGLILLFAMIATVSDKKYYTREQYMAINFLYGITALVTVGEILLSSQVLIIMFGIAIGLLIVFMSLESPDYAKAVAAKEEAERAKIEADKANSAKSEFLARMSHEIRTPMNAILGMNEMIINSTHEEQIKIYSSDAYNAAHNLLDIINDILDFSRIESGKLSLINDKYSLTSILRDLWVLFGTKAKEKGLEIEFDIDRNLNDERIGDRVRIRQILINLLNNAIKYTDEGQITLRVSAAAKGDHPADGLKADPADDVVSSLADNPADCLICDRVRYEVIDTGRGIKEEDRDKLFEAFSRIEENKSTNITGTGLGISITTSLLNLMGSSLEVESEYGKGSDFSFVLEQEIAGDAKVGQYETASLEDVVVTDSTVRATGKRVLCVDDTMLNLKVFRAFLKEAAVDVDIAESAKEALVLTGMNTYDLIFMDHLMPEIDGIECFNMIRAQEGGLNHDTPMIVLTANAIKGAREQYSEAGFIDVCFKPYTKDDLTKIINKYLI